MTDIVIAAYRRSPFHFAHKGGLTKLRPDEMTAQVIRALVASTWPRPGARRGLGARLRLSLKASRGLNMASSSPFLSGAPKARRA
jgi:acetyl-CoA acyltransferase